MWIEDSSFFSLSALRVRSPISKKLDLKIRKDREIKQRLIGIQLCCEVLIRFHFSLTLARIFCVLLLCSSSCRSFALQLFICCLSKAFGGSFFFALLTHNGMFLQIEILMRISNAFFSLHLSCVIILHSLKKTDRWLYLRFSVMHRTMNIEKR